MRQRLAARWRGGSGAYARSPPRSARCARAHLQARATAQPSPTGQEASTVAAHRAAQARPCAFGARPEPGAADAAPAPATASGTLRCSAAVGRRAAVRGVCVERARLARPAPIASLLASGACLRAATPRRLAWAASRPGQANSRGDSRALLGPSSALTGTAAERLRRSAWARARAAHMPRPLASDVCPGRALSSRPRGLAAPRQIHTRVPRTVGRGLAQRRTSRLSLVARVRRSRPRAVAAVAASEVSGCRRGEPLGMAPADHTLAFQM
jgi:hypothetical protein